MKTTTDIVPRVHAKVLLSIKLNPLLLMDLVCVRFICYPSSSGSGLCRTWFAKLSEASDGFVSDILPDGLAAAAQELSPYLQHSFGNSTRLDYGTGHETTFVAFLYCLAALGKAHMQHQLGWSQACVMGLELVEGGKSNESLGRRGRAAV